MNIVLLGRPASGKGTQARALKDKHNLYWIAVGDILRSRAMVQDELGIKLQGYLSNGILVPSSDLIKVIEEKLLESLKYNGFILDGYPRNLEQAIAFDELLKKLHLGLPVVINMDVSKEEALDRILGRLICKKCGATYHIDHQQPKIKGVCDYCQGNELIKRNDDNKEVAARRFATYELKTLPIVEHYKEQGCLKNIDASGNASDVTARIENIIRFM